MKYNEMIQVKADEFGFVNVSVFGSSLKVPAAFVTSLCEKLETEKAYAIYVTARSEWSITYNPKPIGTNEFDYEVTHDDYSGPGDDRHAQAASREEAIKMIAHYEEHGEF